MSARTGFVASSETATARIAAMRESMAYREGIVVIMAVAEMERVIVPRSRDASGSSESVRGRVDVRGEGARLAPSTEFDDTGVVTRIVGGWHVDLPLEGVETDICSVPCCFL